MSVPAAVGPASVLHLDVAGRPLTVEALDPDAAAAVLPALGHLTTDRPAGVATRFRVWSDDDQVHPLWEADAGGPLRLGAHGLAMSRPAPPTVEVFEPEYGIELWGTRSAMAAGDTRAHPASTATAAWLASEGAQVLHAGAVVFDGAAALLIGAAGAGKSTTTIACGLAGASVVGDDLCVVDIDRAADAMRVHSLYATLKVNPDTDTRLSVEHWPTLGHTPKGKRVVAIEAPLRLHAHAPLGAIVVLRAPGSGPVTPTRLRPGAAVRALAPTALSAALGAGGLDDWFAMAVRLARTVPAYELPLSWDLARVVSGVASTVTSAG